MHVFWGGPVLAVDDSSVRDIRCALPRWSWSAGRPQRAWPPAVSASLALTDATHCMPHPLQTGRYGYAPQALAVVRLPGPAWWQRHVAQTSRGNETFDA